MKSPNSVQTINLSWKRFFLGTLILSAPIIGIMVYDIVSSGSLTVGSHGVVMAYASAIIFLSYRFQAVKKQRGTKSEVVSQEKLGKLREEFIGSPFFALIWLLLTVVGLIAYAVYHTAI